MAAPAAAAGMPAATGPTDAERLAKFTDLGAGELQLEGTTEPTCPAGAYIFLMTEQKRLLRFDPTTLAIVELGGVECTDAEANSMAIDRNANAWIGYHEGEIWKLPTSGGACQSSGYTAKQLGWLSFGMAFVSDTADSESLYLAVSEPGAALGRVDPNGQLLTKIADFGGDLRGARCELTGLGDGRMFALCPGERSYLAELDKTTGAVRKTTRLPFVGARDFAFAHWGGAFYLFTSVKLGESRIDRFKPDIGTERLKVVPYDVLGAGVSTCAPTQTVVK